MEESLGHLALLWEHRVHRVLVQAVNQLNEVLLEQAELFGDSDLQGVEGLLDKHLLVVLGCEGEDVDNYAPARLNVGSLGAANVSDAHDDVFFDL